MQIKVTKDLTHEKWSENFKKFADMKMQMDTLSIIDKVLNTAKNINWEIGWQAERDYGFSTKTLCCLRWQGNDDIDEMRDRLFKLVNYTPLENISRIEKEFELEEVINRINAQLFRVNIPGMKPGDLLYLERKYNRLDLDVGRDLDV